MITTTSLGLRVLSELDSELDPGASQPVIMQQEAATPNSHANKNKNNDNNRSQIVQTSSPISTNPDARNQPCLLPACLLAPKQIGTPITPK